MSASSHLLRQNTHRSGYEWDYAVLAEAPRSQECMPQISFTIPFTIYLAEQAAGQEIAAVHNATLCRETQPKKSRKHTEPSAPAKKLAPAPESPADMKVALWEPPASPYFLIEEVLYDNPWKLLVACMLLNKTTGRAVSLAVQIEIRGFQSVTKYPRRLEQYSLQDCHSCWAKANPEFRS